MKKTTKGKAGAADRGLVDHYVAETKLKQPKGMPKLQMQNLRRPLAEGQTPSEIEESQIGYILLREGGPSLEEARDSEEWSGFEVIDVADAKSGEVRYQLYLYGYGSGVLLDHEGTTRFGEVIQHSYSSSDPRLDASIGVAYQAARKKLGIGHSVSFAPYDERDDKLAGKVDWKSLQHANGAATDIPKHIKNLLGDDEYEAEKAFRLIYWLLVGPRFNAAAPTLDALMTAVPQAKQKSRILVLAAEILGGDHVRAWLAPLDEALPADLVAVMGRHKRTLLDASRSSEAEVRAAALLLLSLYSDDACSIALRARADGDPVVQASALLALGRVGAQAEIEAARTSPSPLVRGAATLALLRLDRKLALTDVAEGLEAWLSATEKIPWFGGLGGQRYISYQFLSATAHGLVELARWRGDALADFARRLGAKSSNGVVTQRAGNIVVAVGGFLRFSEADAISYDRYERTSRAMPALPEELTAEERRLAIALADTWLIPRGGFGIAPAGACRKRWLGLLPGAPLVTYELDGKSRTGTLWRAYFDLPPRLRPFEPSFTAEVAPLDRWQLQVEVTAEMGDGGYLYALRLENEKLEAELQRVAEDQALFTRIHEIADDLALRTAAAGREGAPLACATMTRLLFLPWVRAGHPLEPRWDPLVFVGVREVFASLPEERREARMWNAGADSSDPWAPLRQDATKVLDLAPSKRIIDRIAVALEHPQVRQGLIDMDNPDLHKNRFLEILKQRPDLTEAFAVLL
jgi:hypothetical protein